MTATVNGQNITITDESLVVGESVGIYYCDFTFDSSWDGWRKTAKYEGAGETKEYIIVNGRARVPWEVLKACEGGWMKIGVYGTKEGAVMPTIWSDQIYVNEGTVPESIELIPTPSIYAQILALANDAKDIAEDAQDTADDVASDWASVSATATTLSAGSPATVTFADNTFAFGIPKGAKGDTGATGATGATPDFSIGTVSTLETGQPATATITGTAAAPVLNLGLPKGNKGDNGDVANTAPAYSTSATYAVGDYCIYNSQLYRCTTAITTAEAWTAAHWTAVQLGGDVSTLRSALECQKYQYKYTEPSQLLHFGKVEFIEAPQGHNVKSEICSFNGIANYSYTLKFSTFEEIIGTVYVYVYLNDSSSASYSYALNSSTPEKTVTYSPTSDTKYTVKYLEQNSSNKVLTGRIEVVASNTPTNKALSDANAVLECIDYRKIDKTQNYLVRGSNGAHENAPGFYYKRYDISHVNSVKLTPNFTNANYGYALYDSSSSDNNRNAGYLDGSNYVSTDTITLDTTGCTYLDVTSKDGGESIVEANFTQTLRKTLGIDELEEKADCVLGSEDCVGSAISTRVNYFLQDNGDNTGIINSASNFTLLTYDMRHVSGFVYVQTTLVASSCIGFLVNGAISPVTKVTGKIQIPNNAELLYVSLYTGSGKTVDDVLVLANFIPQMAFNRSNIYGKALGVFGDSIVAGNGYGGGWAKIIGERNHMSVLNTAISGGTIMEFAGHPHIPDMLTNDFTDCDYILFDGCVNDFALQGFVLGEMIPNYINSPAYDTSTFIGSLEKLCYDIRALLVGKKIGYVFNHRIFKNTDTNTNGSNTWTWLETEQAIKSVLKKWGISYVDISEDSPSLNLLDAYRDAYTAHTETFPSGDGWHPNESGYKTYYCDRIEAWMKTL